MRELLLAAALLSCASSRPAVPVEDLLSVIDGSYEDYDLPIFYLNSRAFLRRFPGHGEADRIRYQFALQLITESLTKPDSPLAHEGRELLQEQMKLARSEARRFEAGLVLLKFATRADRPRHVERMLRAFPKNEHLVQVYYFAVDSALGEGNMVGAGRYAKALLDRFPQAEDRERYALIHKRAGLIGTSVPWPKDLRADLRAKLSGKVVLIDFWATWCEPCVAALPHLKALHARRASKGFEILSVNLDEEPRVYERFLEKNALMWPTVSTGVAKSFADDIGVTELPLYVLVDRRGHLRNLDLGWDDLGNAIDQLLAEGFEAKGK